MQGHSSHSPGCIMTNRLCVFIYNYSYMKTYSLFVMIHPGEWEEWPCIVGMHEVQLGDSLHIYIFIYASSYMISKYGEAATIGNHPRSGSRAIVDFGNSIYLY